MSSRYRNPTVRPSWYKARQRAIVRSSLRPRRLQPLATCRSHTPSRSQTPAQKRAERKLWPLFGLTFFHNQPIDLERAFGRDAPRVLEIGCGNGAHTAPEPTLAWLERSVPSPRPALSGEAIVQLAAARPSHDFLGVDWLRRGHASCLATLQDQGLENVRLVRADAATLLKVGLPAAPLFDEVKVFFPDPWYGSPERRLLRKDVVEQLSLRMRPSGCLHVATGAPAPLI
jgi:tRNA (guanine-N7-)-methyltransferase